MTSIERRQVTVFFSDVCDFTPLSEQYDPEDVREAMGEVFAVAHAVAEKYGGRIDKLLGDGVLAIFGDPVAHEDDPERAVRAVLDLHAGVEEIGERIESRLGTSIALHSGIASGVVLTGKTDARGGAGPLGDPVNVASRLQSIAAPGQILIAPETHHLTAGAFDVKALGPQQLKGKAEPVDVWEVVGIAPERRRASRVRGEFVGRQEELGVLLAAVERMRDGQAGVISVCGEAGAGKTRLLEEFAARLPGDVTWLEGRAYPYSQNIPYATVIDLLNRVLGIDEGDTSDTLRDKLTEGVGALVGADNDVLAPLAALYALELPGVPPIDREAYQPALVNAVRRLIDVQSRTQPTVICLQDLHWADPSTVTLVRELTARPDASVLFVCNFRPGFTLGAVGERALHLDELSGRQSAQLVSSLLGSASPPPELTKFIETRTDGNPFFIEEIINRLIETNAVVRANGSWELARALDHIDMPSTIRGVIQARIDHLDIDQRVLLREASVVGRDFLYRVVSRVSRTADDLDVGLSGLESADLIRQKSSDPDLEYFFKHALTQEVAYEGLVRDERKELHGRVAEAIESMLADRTSEFVETLAFHYVRAGNTARSVHYLIESGRKAIARYSFSEARTFFENAYAILMDDSAMPERPRTISELVIEWSLLHYYDGTITEWLTLLLKHMPDAETCGDDSILSMYLGWIGNAQFLHGELDSSLANLERALALASAAGDDDVVAFTKAWLTFTVEERGDVRGAIEIGQSAVHRPELLQRDPYPWIKRQGGVLMSAMAAAELDLLREISDEMIAFGVETGNARAEVFGHMGRSGCALVSLDDETAVGHSMRAVAAARDPIYGAFAAYTLAASAAGSLDFAVATTAVADWLPQAESAGNVYAAVNLSLYDGLMSMIRGDYSRGIDRAVAARDALLRMGFLVAGCYADVALAWVYTAIARREVEQPTIGRLARNPRFVVAHILPAKRNAHRLIDAVLERATGRGWMGTFARAHFARARLHALDGNNDAAKRSLDEIHTFLRDRGVSETPKVVLDLESSLR